MAGLVEAVHTWSVQAHFVGLRAIPPENFEIWVVRDEFGAFVESNLRKNKLNVTIKNLIFLKAMLFMDFI